MCRVKRIVWSIVFFPLHYRWMAQIFDFIEERWKKYRSVHTSEGRTALKAKWL